MAPVLMPFKISKIQSVKWWMPLNISITPGGKHKLPIFLEVMPKVSKKFVDSRETKDEK